MLGARCSKARGVVRAANGGVPLSSECRCRSLSTSYRAGADMKRSTKIVLLTPVAIVIILFNIVIVLAVVARSRGVEATPIPQGSLIATVAADADYAGAYRVPVSPLDFPTVEVFDALAFEQGDGVVGQSPEEIVFRGQGPGMQYQVCYRMSDSDDQLWVTMSTAVHYESTLGKMSFGAVRLVHWGVTPWVLSSWAEEK